MKNVKVNCGDWHLSWGLSGNNKIGTLTKTEDNQFLWKGHSQGRHGQKWNKGAELVFTLSEDAQQVVVQSQKGEIPRRTELLKGVLDLEREILDQQSKQRQKALKQAKKTQKQSLEDEQTKLDI